AVWVVRAPGRDRVFESGGAVEPVLAGPTEATSEATDEDPNVPPSSPTVRALSSLPGGSTAVVCLLRDDVMEGGLNPLAGRSFSNPDPNKDSPPTDASTDSRLSNCDSR